MVKSVVDTMLVNASGKEVALHLDCDLKIPLELIGDPHRVCQIVFNVIGNAVKFSAQSGSSGVVGIKTRVINLDRSAEQCRIQIEISDNGIGIKDGEIQNLFLPFTQAESSTTRRYGGTGLGLAICHHLVTLMGGDIRVISQIGQGATFTVELPFGLTKNVQPLQFDSHGLSLLLDIKNDSLNWLVKRYLNFLNIDFFTLDQPGAQKNLIDHLPDRGATLVHIRDYMEASPIDRLCQRNQSVKCMLLNPDNYGSSGLIDGATYALGAAPLKVTSLLLALDVLMGRESPNVSYKASETQTAEVFQLTLKEAESEGKLILVAEDNPVNQDVISRQLKRLGYRCVIANDGIEAEAVYGKHKFAMVLTDCHMPNRDGYELARILKKQQSADGHFVPVIAITANALLGEEQKCLDAGMDGYLSKPVERSKLKKLLKKWLAGEDKKHKSEKEHNISLEPSGSEVAGLLDKAVIQSIYGGEMEDYYASLEDFRAFILPDIAQINLVDLQNYESLKGSMHRYKSAAKAIGANALADQMQVIELQCEHESPDAAQIEAMIQALQRDLPELDRAIVARMAV